MQASESGNNEGGMSGDLEQQVVATSTVVGAEVEGEQGGEQAAPSGIGWGSVSTVVVSQVSILGLFHWLASPEIREWENVWYCLLYGMVSFRVLGWLIGKLIGWYF